MKEKKKGSRFWRTVRRIFLILFLLQLFYIILLKWVNPPITITQLQSWISGNGMHRKYISSDQMAYNVKLAVIASEDQLFPDHGGFDWKAIDKAIKHNEKKPNRIHGGSTISQQVAKNVFLWQGRDYLRKGLELYFTKMIEWIWGKKRILEVYLNVIEMGRGVFGVEQASQTYFGKPAKSLTKLQAAMIAACLPNPKEFTVKPLSRHVAIRSAEILRQMSNLEGDEDIEKIIE